MDGGQEGGVAAETARPTRAVMAAPGAAVSERPGSSAPFPPLAAETPASLLSLSRSSAGYRQLGISFAGRSRGWTGRSQQRWRRCCAACGARAAERSRSATGDRGRRREEGGGGVWCPRVASRELGRARSCAMSASDAGCGERCC